MTTDSRLSPKELMGRIGLAMLFVALGYITYIVFSPLRPLLDRGTDYLGRIGLIIILAVAVYLVRRSHRFEKYWHLLFGFLIMAITVTLDWVFAIYLVDHLGVNGSTPFTAALQKLNECALVVCVIVLLTRLSCGSLGSIYIQKGNLKLGLIVGLVTFIIAAAGSIPMAGLFRTQSLSLARIIPWLPWVLIFVLANATQEELLFRGLFLRKLEPFFGKFISNFLVVFVFTFMHGSVTYTSDLALFLGITFLLGLAWGYLMQKTNSIWGSILFHAGMDIPVMLGIFANL